MHCLRAAVRRKREINLLTGRDFAIMTNKKQNILYVAFTYAFFWILFLLTGGTMLWLGEGLPFKIMVSLCSWAPTIALFVLFKRLYPNSSIKNFYINAFKRQINWKMMLTTGALQLLIFIVAVNIVSFTKGVSLLSLLNLSSQTIVMGFIMTLIQGATGEESGWRGFLQPSAQKNFSVIKASLIIGVIWGFWHTPLWLTSGYSGIKLLQYMFVFLISIVSVSVVIGICYNRSKNLFVPIFIHFMFNFFITVFTGDALELLTWFAALYALMAVGYILWFQRYNGIVTPTK